MPTAENRRFVTLALVCGQSEDDIATALRITAKTLGRHYFHELAGKRSARLRLEIKNMAAIVAGSDAGVVGAMALLDKKLEKLRLRELTPVAPIAKGKAKTGKKDLAAQAARDATGLYGPRPGPAAKLN